MFSMTSRKVAPAQLRNSSARCRRMSHSAKIIGAAAIVLLAAGNTFANAAENPADWRRNSMPVPSSWGSITRGAAMTPASPRSTQGHILGTDGEQALKARLEKRSNGIPVLLTCPAAVAAFNALDVRRIALIHPPWFADDQQHLGIKYFRNQGFDVVYANQMRLMGLSVAQPADPLRRFSELYPAEL